MMNGSQSVSMQLCRTLGEMLSKLAGLLIYKEIKDSYASTIVVLIACRELTVSDNSTMTCR